MNPDKVRWGILSTSNFAVRNFIPAMLAAESAEVVAIASRDPARAEAAARELGIPKAHASYEQLLADPVIDVVYNPLPNHLHVPWSIRALEAGKHVLCEKPIALDAVEARELAAAAAAHPELQVMEAFMYRFHPQWGRVRDLIAHRTIGDLRTVRTAFSYFNDDPGDIRNRPEAGGGALLDIGCYAISVSRWLFDDEPHRAQAAIEIDPRFGTDRFVTGSLVFGRGTATFTAATQMASYQRVTIQGTAGWIEVETPFNPHPELPSRIMYRSGPELDLTTLMVEPANQYTILVDEFCAAVLEHRAPAITLADAVENMRAIDAVFASAARGGWVAC